MSKINRTVLHDTIPSINRFTDGGTSRVRTDLFMDSGNNLYYWGGEFPKEVPAGSTVESTGGVSSSTWVQVAGTSLDDYRIITEVPTGLGLTDFVSILDFDGVYCNDTSKDSTDGFLNAINQAPQLYVPTGEYRVDSSVITKANHKIVFAKGAKLLRLSKYSSSTEPVFILRGTQSESSGGQFITENNHPNGVVMCGHSSTNDTQNALWWKMVHPFIKGVQAKGNIGINVVNAQVNLGSSSANYFGTIDSPIIHFCDEGIVFQEIANAHTVIAPQLYRCISAGISYYGAYANYVVGGFLHSSTDGVIGVNIRNRRVGTDHHSSANQINGFGVEPGGTSSKALYIDTECTRNRIFIMGNVAGGSTVLNPRNDYNTVYSNRTFESTIRSLQVLDSVHTLNLKRLFNPKNNVRENSVVDFFTVKIPSNGSGYYLKCTLSARSNALDYVAPVQHEFYISNRTGTSTVSSIRSTSTSKNCGTVTAVASGDTITISGKSFNNGTNTLYNNFSMSIEVESSESAFTGVVITPV